MVESGTATSQQGEVYPSPDGRFVVYSLAPESTETYPRRTYLAMMDLVRREEVIFKQYMLNSSSQFYIEWGSGSNAFILRTWGDYGYIPYPTYFGGFAEDVTKAKMILLGHESVFEKELSWGIYQTYDLDSTGKYLLAEGYLYRPEYEPGFLRLLVINMDDFSYSIVGEARYFTTARFEQPSDTRVFYLNDIGIFSYNRDTMKTTLLTKATNQMRLARYITSYPIISPDGRHLATQLRSKQGVPEDDNLYVIPIPPAP
jgi:hypothetical protein